MPRINKLRLTQAHRKLHKANTLLISFERLPKPIELFMSSLVQGSSQIVVRSTLFTKLVDSQ